MYSCIRDFLFKFGSPIDAVCCSSGRRKTRSARPRIRKRLAVNRLRSCKSASEVSSAANCCRRGYVASFLRRRCRRTRSRRAVCAAASDDSRTPLCLQLSVAALLRPRRRQPLKSSGSRLRPSSKTRPEEVQQQRAPYKKSPLQRVEPRVSQVA